MDLRKIKKLIELVEESGITELEVSNGDEAVRIARPQPAASPLAVPAASVTSATVAVPVEPAAGTAAQRTAEIEVRAPMAGTFYAAPEPGATAFVQPGDGLQPQEIICIIESMKMMNEIRLEQGGECVEVLVANGEPVSAAQLLFRFRSSG